MLNWDKSAWLTAMLRSYNHFHIKYIYVIDFLAYVGDVIDTWCYFRSTYIHFYLRFMVNLSIKHTFLDQIHIKGFTMLYEPNYKAYQGKKTNTCSMFCFHFICFYKNSTGHYSVLNNILENYFPPFICQISFTFSCELVLNWTQSPKKSFLAWLKSTKVRKTNWVPIM